MLSPNLKRQAYLEGIEKGIEKGARVMGLPYQQFGALAGGALGALGGGVGGAMWDPLDNPLASGLAGAGIGGLGGAGLGYGGGTGYHAYRMGQVNKDLDPLMGALRRKKDHSAFKDSAQFGPPLPGDKALLRPTPGNWINPMKAGAEGVQLLIDEPALLKYLPQGMVPRGQYEEYLRSTGKPLGTTGMWDLITGAWHKKDLEKLRKQLLKAGWG